MFLLIIKQDELTGWHSSGVTRTRIRVIGVTFSEILIKGKEILVRVIRDRVIEIIPTPSHDARSWRKHKDMFVLYATERICVHPETG